MSTARERLAVIVPLKDEAAGLAALLPVLERLGAELADPGLGDQGLGDQGLGDQGLADVEFVLVDDGSEDDTWNELQRLFGDRANVHCVQHPQNRGLSAAIRTGIAATDAPLCASIDGDLSYDPLELAAMLRLLREHAADVVTASPYHRAGGVDGVPGWRLLLSRTLSGCYRVLLWSDIRTWTSCFRVYRRDAVVDLPLTEPGFLGTAELLVRVLRRGGVVVEHPCTLGVRQFGASKMRIVRTILGHVGLLLRVLLRRVR